MERGNINYRRFWVGIANNTTSMLVSMSLEGNSGPTAVMFCEKS